jgi:hypothetical protein
MSYSRAANGVAILALISMIFVAIVFLYFSRVSKNLAENSPHLEYYAQYLPQG